MDPIHLLGGVHAVVLRLAEGLLPAALHRCMPPCTNSYQPWRPASGGSERDAKPIREGCRSDRREGRRGVPIREGRRTAGCRRGARKNSDRATISLFFFGIGSKNRVLLEIDFSFVSPHLFGELPNNKFGEKI